MSEQWSIRYNNDNFFQWYVVGPAKVEVGWRGFNLKAAKANANLISAAPDMLEALERIIPTVEYLADGRVEVLAKIKAAKAAIAKAKGEE